MNTKQMREMADALDSTEHQFVYTTPRRKAELEGIVNDYEKFFQYYQELKERLIREGKFEGTISREYDELMYNVHGDLARLRYLTK